MLIKTFEGSSLKDVLRDIKHDFGKDAVILSTEENKVADSSATFYRVRAAVPEAARVDGASASIGRNPDKALEAWMKRLDQKVEDLAEVALNNRKLTELEGDMRELKVMLYEAMRNQLDQDKNALSPAVLNIYQHLLLTGLDKANINELLTYLGALTKVNADEADADFYRTHAIRWMLKRIRIAPALKVTDDSPEIHLFIGASGSGKTSMVAKLAAQLKTKNSKDIVVISFDNLRIGANEQLKVYANILDIPYLTIARPDEIHQRIANNKSGKLFLIDTAGCCSKDEQELSHLLAIVEKAPIPLKTHLVMSLTEKQVQLDQGIRTFSELGINHLAFTKLDQSWTYGEIYNLANRWSIPISYFGTGQTVPRDLEHASRERVVERMFRL